MEILIDRKWKKDTYTIVTHSPSVSQADQAS